MRAPRRASSRPEIGALVAGEPERVGRHRLVRTANHLELEIRDHVLQRHRRPFDEVARAVAARLLAAEPGEDHGALRPLPLGQRFRQLEHSGAAGRVIVGAVEDRVRAAAVAAEMIEMRGQQDRVVRHHRIAALQSPDGVPGVAWHLGARRLERDDGAVGHRRYLGMCPRVERDPAHLGAAAGRRRQRDDASGQQDRAGPLHVPARALTARFRR